MSLREHTTHVMKTVGEAGEARPETRLADAVGNCRANALADVRWVKDALERLGRYGDRHERNGYLDRALHEAICGYQRDNGLRCDGWLRPGGETESTIRVELIRLGKE